MRTIKKRSSRMLAVLLSIMMIFTMIPQMAFADSGAESPLAVSLDGTSLPVSDKGTYSLEQMGLEEAPYYEVTVPAGTEAETALEITYNGAVVPQLFAIDGGATLDPMYYPSETYGEFIACDFDWNVYCVICFAEGSAEEPENPEIPAVCKHENTTTSYAPAENQKHTVTAVCDSCSKAVGDAQTADCTDGDQNGACDFCGGSVPVAVADVSVNPTSATLEIGQTITLSAAVEPAAATDKTVTWSSSNEAVATVDANGKVTAVAAGTAVITVTTADGRKTDSCTVTVVDESTVPEGYYEVTINAAPSASNVTFYSGDKDETQLAASAVKDNGIVGGYHQYILTVPEGLYSFRAAEGEQNLGGMSFNVPVEDEIMGDGTASGAGQVLYLVRTNWYTTDSSVKNIGDYTLRLLPGALADAVNGTQYIDESGYVVTPVMILGRGNALTYQAVFTMNGELADTKAAAPMTNMTFGQGTKNQTFTVTDVVTHRITAPAGAKVQMFNQLKNYNVEEITANKTDVNEDGTVTSTFATPGGDNLTYRVSMEGKITRAGYMGRNAEHLVITFEESENPATTEHVMDSASIQKRMEASTLVNVNAQNNLKLGIGDTFRLRSFRGAWQIINTDTMNIMIEPDFNYNVISGEEHIEMTPASDRCTGNAGSGDASNWMDIKGVSEGTAIIEVSYDAIKVESTSSAYHTGLYGATDPKRKSLIVINVDSEGNSLQVTADGASHVWDTEFDTAYFTGESGSMTFTAVMDQDAPDTAALSTDKGQTWTALEAVDGKYVAAGLIEGNNILRFTKGEKTEYQVVRAARVTYTIVNKTREGDDVIVGDTLSITVKGMYTPLSKLSGIYNPGFAAPNHNLAYKLPDGVTATATGGQYDFINNHTYEVTFNSVGECTLTGGHIYHTNMGSAAGSHRNLTDDGVGTNMSASNGNWERSTFPDLTFNVIAMPVVAVTVNASEEDATITIFDESGNEISLEDGQYKLQYGTYEYIVSKEGYVTERGTFNVSSKDKGEKTVFVNLRKVGGAIWDGKTLTPAEKNADGFYELSTGAQLAWFAQTQVKTDAASNAILTADISLGGFEWTPISGFKGTFDGNGHYVTDLYINQPSSDYQGLFGKVSGGAYIKNLGVQGVVTGKGNVAGIAAYSVGGKNSHVVIENCKSEVNVTAKRKNAAGILAYQTKYDEVYNCYNTGKIVIDYSSSATASGISIPSMADEEIILKNSYNTGRVSGTSSKNKTAAVAYFERAAKTGNVVNCYGLASSCSAKMVAGTAVSDAELKVLASTLGDAYMDNPTEEYNNGYPILKWEEARVLPIVKAEQIEAISTYKSAEDYREAEQTELAAAVESAKNAIQAAESLEAVETAVSEAKTAMDGIKTKAQYEAEELQGIKEAAIAEIKAYKNPADYGDAEKSLLNSEIIRAEAAINLCETAEEVAAAAATAKSRMDAIKKSDNKPQSGTNKSVTVYFSVSHDEEFFRCANGEVMALKEITVPYFDLANYGLEKYYFNSESYASGGGSGSGTAETANGKITAMHLIIYATEVYYCGIDPSEAGQGYLKKAGLLGGNTLTYTGVAGSSYMNMFWGMDENFNYYLNYSYPLASPGWGSTSDQILLKNGDLLTVGHFTSWDFHLDSESVFNYIKAGYSTVETSAKQGEKVDLTVYRAGAGSNYTTAHKTVAGIDVYCIEMSKLVNGDVSRWTKIGTTDAQGKITVDTKDFTAGQYMFAVEGQYGSEYKNAIVSTPGAIILNLTANPNAAPQEVTEVTTSKDAGTTTTPTEVTVTGSTATATITKENVTETIKQATENKSAEIVVQVTESDTKGASNVKVQLDTTTVKDVVNKTEAALTVKTENATVTLDRETLKTVAAEATGSTVTLEVIEVAKPTEVHKEAAGENGHVIQLVIKSGNKIISLFNEGKATVTVEIPDKLADKRVAAIHIGDDGKVEHLKGQEVTVGGKKHYRFDTPHFSTFALVDADEIGLEVEEQMTADEVKALIADLTPIVRSVKTPNKNTKVTLKLDKADKAIIEELEAEGLTVKYNFYRSTKKASKYKSMLIKSGKSYTNTKGKKNQMYYYKVRVQVYDAEGKLIARTALKDCRYANRQWTK